MTEKTKYKCPKCGQYHNDWPAIAFSRPFYYDDLTDEEKTSIATLSDDFCVIKHPDQTDRFIRVVLKQKVTDNCEGLDYGVWVSLSEKSYNDYHSNFKTENYQEGYFGYLANNIPGYENTLSIRMNVYTAKGGRRPEIVPQDGQLNNPFVADYFNGISVADAQNRVDDVLGRNKTTA